MLQSAVLLPTPVILKMFIILCPRFDIFVHCDVLLFVSCQQALTPTVNTTDRQLKGLQDI